MLSVNKKKCSGVPTAYLPILSIDKLTMVSSQCLSSSSNYWVKSSIWKFELLQPMPVVVEIVDPNSTLTKLQSQFLVGMLI